MRSILRATTFVLAMSMAVRTFAQNPPRGNGYVGVTLAVLEDASDYGIRGRAIGAYSVVEGGPAYKAGLRAEDVITSINGRSVTDSDTAAAMLQAHNAGDKIRMGIIHLFEDGRRIQIELGITAETRPTNYGRTVPPNDANSGGGLPGIAPVGDLRFVNPNSVTQGAVQRSGNCTAVTPQGWGILVSPTSDGVDLFDPARQSGASWGIHAINTAMRPYYGDLYGPPEASALATASIVVGAQARYTGPASGLNGYFTVMPFAGGGKNGMILFHAYSSPFPGQYILSVYIAWAGAPNLLPTAQAVLASISCQTQLRPAEPVSVKAAKPGTKRNAGKGGEGDSLKDYNAQLGTQWAHSASGQHYLLDRASQWNDNGPDGPGYYAKIGNSMEKLTTGW